MVFLDVVYNHFGPEGNYLPAYADYFFTDKYKTPWGQAINFDGQNSNIVRQFFIDNALYWLHEFHFDGLRFDAVHAIHDQSNVHIIEEISTTIKELAGGQHKHIILENDDNGANFLARDTNNSPLYATAQWNDDIHHIFHVLATKENEGYYADYACTNQFDKELAKLGRALTEGFIYQGEISQVHEGKKRGQLSKFLPTLSFISFLQNHDQIGNRAFGERLSIIAQTEQLRALTAIFLLSPQIPMLFMAEEWFAKTPFYYFCNLGPDLAPVVTKGRREEFKKFPSFNSPDKLQAIPDPCLVETFEQSKLNWQELQNKENAHWLDYYKTLLSLRTKYIVPRLDRLSIAHASYKIFADSVLNVIWPAKDEYLLLIANLSEKTINIDSELLKAGNTKPFFILPNDNRDLSNDKLAPYSVAWYLVNNSCLNNNGRDN
jgi:malto-oligosyltrehalose trehalohydrolase